MNTILVGDNVEVLNRVKLERVKVVYLDPPYNTRTCKAYSDSLSSSEYVEHMYSVLSAVRAQMCNDGVIFVSIDDTMLCATRSCLDKIFGEVNFIGTFITNQSKRSNAKLINTVHEYVLCYSKNKRLLTEFSLKRKQIPEQRIVIERITSQVQRVFEKSGVTKAAARLRALIKRYGEQPKFAWLKNYKCVDDAGRIFFPTDLSKIGEPNSVNIPDINLYLEPLPNRRWLSDKLLIKLHNAGLLTKRNGRPYKKLYLDDAVDNVQSKLDFYSRHGSRDLEKLGLQGVFDTPKPVELIKFLIRIVGLKSGDTVLDCYGGSGTTAQAVFEINAEDEVEINSVLIQKDEPINPKSPAYKACLAHGIEPNILAVLNARVERAQQRLAK